MQLQLNVDSDAQLVQNLLGSKLIGMKAGEISKRLSVHPNTIRNWSDEFASFLSGDTTAEAPGGRRRYSEADVHILATIAQLKQQGLKNEQVHEALSAGRRAKEVPPAPTPQEEEVRQSVALVLRSEYDHALDRIKELHDERGRLIEERNAALMARDQDVTALNERIAGLQNELGRAQGQLDALQRERLSTRTVLWIIVGVVVVALVIVIALVVLVSQPR